MTISKKHFINIAKIIDDNSKHNDDDKQILVNALSNYFKSENKNFDSIRFYNACFKTFKHVSDDQKKDIKILQSKVKTYEQDIINKPLNDMPTNINGRPFKGRL